MYIERAHIPPERRPPPDRWPLTVPAVSQLANTAMAFTAPVTFLVGDNGSGKSTIVEAIAEQLKLDARGGRLARRGAAPDDQGKTVLGDMLRLEMTAAGYRMMGGPRLKKKGFFLRAETAFSMTENLGGVPGYWQNDTSAMSHGEGFLEIFAEMLQQPGIYLMDEPEAALSFTSCLQLVALMHELGKSGAQVICATHSPILAATPDAAIIELGDHGFRTTTWAELELVDHWRRYLADPRSYLRHVLASGDQ